ncbi:hypothetical protein CPAR01_05998 [Colletotrichum paranaense]|uniref:Uncharacterized protein n=1 Tax=Colletotrichum paranaense TaxID=1914294 RepID=A0ABQ9SSW2_9PEZI|nr:uncharacterized protein CPAR01_05998 [Colletotrichum paranaense]KAK1542611.1 hypothetical protein CPAR01_05998 [Colletotrichum paranaense]
MSGNTLYGSGSHGRCSHGGFPGKFGGLPLKVARVAGILQLAIGPHPSPPRTRSMFYECPWAHVPIQTRRQGFFDWTVPLTSQWHHPDSRRMARFGAFDIESGVNPACLSTTPWVSKIGPLLAHLARPQLFRSCIWSASDYSQRQQGPANRFLGGTGGTRCGGRDGTGMHPADWHDDEEMRHEISGSQGT